STLAEADGAVSPSASPTPTPPPEPSTEPETGAEPPDEGVVVGSIRADGPEEEALAELAVDYWTMLFQMYSEAEVDRGAFSMIARGNAYQGPVDYVGQLQRNDLRQQGGAVMHVQDVS